MWAYLAQPLPTSRRERPKCRGYCSPAGRPLAAQRKHRFPGSWFRPLTPGPAGDGWGCGRRRTRTQERAVTGRGRGLGPLPSRLAPPRTQDLSRQAQPSLLGAPSSLTPVSSGQACDCQALQSPTCSPSALPGPHLCCRSQSCGLLTPSAASSSCPPCSASSGPSAPGLCVRPTVRTGCFHLPSHHELPGAGDSVLAAQWVSHQ